MRGLRLGPLRVSSVELEGTTVDIPSGTARVASRVVAVAVGSRVFASYHRPSAIAIDTDKGATRISVPDRQVLLRLATVALFAVGLIKRAR